MRNVGNTSVDNVPTVRHITSVSNGAGARWAWADRDATKSRNTEHSFVIGLWSAVLTTLDAIG